MKLKKKVVIPAGTELHTFGSSYLGPHAGVVLGLGMRDSYACFIMFPEDEETKKWLTE